MKKNMCISIRFRVISFEIPGLLFSSLCLINFSLGLTSSTCIM